MRLRELARAFAIDVDAWAVMENHLHLLLTRRPDLLRTWSDRDIVERWLAVKPLKSRGRVLEVTEEAVGSTLLDRARVAKLRQRLCDLGWFHSLVKQPLAEMANREDGCTGHFWDGRFIPEVIVDPTHLLAASVYIDLNPIRANLAKSPEQSDFTSVQDRIRVLQFVERRSMRSERDKDVPSHLLRCAVDQVTNADADVWLTPIRQEGDRRGLSPSIDLADYVMIVDRTGRQVRPGKRGRIDPSLPPILERLEIDVDRFIKAVKTGKNLSDVRIQRAS